MVAGTLAGNISPEATNPSGNMFADATRGSKPLYFTRRIATLMSDESYAALQAHTLLHLEAGALIRGSGDLRKLRWELAIAVGRG